MGAKASKSSICSSVLSSSCVLISADSSDVCRVLDEWFWMDRIDLYSRGSLKNVGVESSWIESDFFHTRRIENDTAMSFETFSNHPSNGYPCCARLDSIVN